jgi:glyoxalase family protein
MTALPSIQQDHAIQGIHHITIVASDAARTVDFYTRVLGLRLVKQTVNFDDPTSYHLYFGDDLGRPGTAVTFFEWRGAPQGSPGIGGTHHYAFSVPDRDGLLRWKRRLTDHGQRVNGPLDRHYFTSIYFNDPDGTIIEIATRGPGWTIDESPDALGSEYRDPPHEMTVANRDAARIAADTWPEPVDSIDPGMALAHGIHHITAIGADIARTDAFFGDLLGMRRVKMTKNFDDPTSAHWYWGVGDGAPGTVITYFERKRERERPVKMGAGQTHHYALSVPSDEAQAAWRERLVAAGLRVSPILDRVYFKSIYTQDPDGHIVELATAGPGFAADEAPADLGTTLKLPPWLEDQRDRIAAGLKPLTATR